MCEETPKDEVTTVCLETDIDAVWQVLLYLTEYGAEGQGGGLAGEEEELANLVERLDKASTAYGMEISAEETKLMTNNTSGINTEIKGNGQKLETVTSFKYLGSVITNEGSKPEILSRKYRQQQL